jgi:hypothetical protein
MNFWNTLSLRAVIATLYVNRMWVDECVCPDSAARGT